VATVIHRVLVANENEIDFARCIHETCQYLTVSEISGSHSCENEDGSLLGMIALLTEAVHTSETPVYFYENTRRHIPEGCHFHKTTLTRFLHVLNLCHYIKVVALMLILLVLQN
jgi:hypothetical protein